MDYETAIESRVTLREARHELRKHDVRSIIDGRNLIAQCDIVIDGRVQDEWFTFEADVDGLFDGGAILAWLGY